MGSIQRTLCPAAATGRLFINRDPVEESGGLNLYGFCGNDAINRFDVNGNYWLSKLWDHTILKIGQQTAINWDHQGRTVAEMLGVAKHRTFHADRLVLPPLCARTIPNFSERVYKTPLQAPITFLKNHDFKLCRVNTLVYLKPTMLAGGQRASDADRDSGTPGGASIGRRPRRSRPPDAFAPGLPFFSVHLLEHLDMQSLVGHESLQPCNSKRWANFSGAAESWEPTWCMSARPFDPPTTSAGPELTCPYRRFGRDKVSSLANR